jgi:hypothetical protein
MTVQRCTRPRNWTMELTIVQAAKKLLVDKGWSQLQNANHEPQGRLDLVLAITRACSTVGLGFSHADEVYELLRHYAKQRSLALWNDTPGRTQDEVLALLTRAETFLKGKIK